MDRGEVSENVKVYSTEELRETTTPEWYLNNLGFQTLCNSDENLPIIFEIWSYNNAGDHSLYGS
jgi:hypothetical protein